MSEEPAVPTRIPTIPAGRLWSALAIPPGVTLIGNLLIGLSGEKVVEPTSSLLIPPVVLMLILGLAITFHRSISGRYRGQSLVFLNIAYVLGQIIVCLALWIGSCLLVFKS